MYSLNWKETRIKRQTKFHRTKVFRTITKAAITGVPQKKVFLKTLQISQENTCFGMSLNYCVIPKTIFHNNGTHHWHFSWKSPIFCEVILDGGF